MITFKSSWANLWGMFRKKKFWKNSSVGDRLTIGRQIKRDDVISSDFEWWLPYKETSAEFSQAKSSKNMACLITFLTLDPFIVYISIFISKWHKSSSDFQTPWGGFFLIGLCCKNVMWWCPCSLKSKVWVKSDTNCQVKLFEIPRERKWSGW